MVAMNKIQWGLNTDGLMLLKAIVLSKKTNNNDIRYNSNLSKTHGKDMI